MRGRSPSLNTLCLLLPCCESDGACARSWRSLCLPTRQNMLNVSIAPSRALDLPEWIVGAAVSPGGCCGDGAQPVLGGAARSPGTQARHPAGTILALTAGTLFRRRCGRAQRLHRRCRGGGHHGARPSSALTVATIPADRASPRRQRPGRGSRVRGIHPAQSTCPSWSVPSVVSALGAWWVFGPVRRRFSFSSRWPSRPDHGYRDGLPQALPRLTVAVEREGRLASSIEEGR